MAGLRLQHCLVYGVSVPHIDGKVGMAALLTEDGAPPPKMDELYETLDAQLPHYAQPRFLRVLASADAIELTATFKPKRQQLVQAGFEPHPSGVVYVREPAARTYVPLSEAYCSSLLDGNAALN